LTGKLQLAHWAPRDHALVSHCFSPRKRHDELMMMMMMMMVVVVMMMVMMMMMMMMCPELTA